MTIKCSRCGETYEGTEHDTEVCFSNHVCKGKRPIKEMPFDLLTRIVEMEITKEKAWKILAERIKKHKHLYQSN